MSEQVKQEPLSTSLDSHPHICPICNKRFECSVQSIYKFQIYDSKSKNKKYEYYCGYTCFRVQQKKNERKRYYKPEREA